MNLLAAVLLLAAQGTLEERRDQKVQSAFLKQSPWITDHAKALEAAKKSDRIIFAYFTRSYSP